MTEFSGFIMFLIGFFTGGTFGVVLHGLLMMASDIESHHTRDSDEHEEGL
jgi:hypothetical protein